MDDRLSRIETAIHDIERSLVLLEHRLTILEHGGGTLRHSTGEFVATGPDPVALPHDVGAIIPLVGRTFVALGGAYLLRALTDSAILPPRVGIAAGLVFAAVWIVAADRDAGRDRRLSAAFHALVGVLIAFPLLWEATVRFQNLPPSGSALVLALFTTGTLAAAVHRNHQAIAWIVVLAALPTAIAVIGATGAIVPFAVYLIWLGIVTLWLGYSCDWLWLRWPAALFADLTVFGLTISGVGDTAAASPAAIVVVQMLLLNAYLASVVVRTIIRSRDVIVFELMQASAALALGFGGAVYVAGHTGSGSTLLALINLVFGVGCYAVAFTFMRQGRPRNFQFYGSLALVLVIASSALLLQPPALAVVATALAVVATLAAARLSTATLTVHALVYLATAGAASGMLRAAMGALAAPVGAVWQPFDGTAMAVVVGSVLCWAIAPPVGFGSSAAPATRLIVAIFGVLSATGAVVALLGSLLPHSGGTAPDPGAIATLRTAVLAGVAVALAWAGRRERFAECRLLLYPVLAAIGLKLLVEDLRRSRAETLFVALALYGLALIAAPRLGRRQHGI
jgi:hypothetical protein